MQRTFALAVAAASLTLTACAALDGGTAAARDSWQGASYEDVVMRWGAPIRSTAFNDGRLVYTWHSQGITTRSNVWPSISIGAGSGMGVGVGVGVGVGASRDVSVACERTMIFKSGRVSEQTWEGPADFCATFKR